MASSQLQVANKKAIWNLYRFGTTQRDILSVVGVLFQRRCNERMREDNVFARHDTEEMRDCSRLFIFIVYTQIMQSLMSYDGGATQMSTEPLLKSGWSSSELGLLGAMDKFGQVATAFLWSYLLMKYNAKVLLFVGLFAKAACCLGFGVLTNKLPMLLSKLGMGVSEALIGVWATVWVQGHAPKDSKARWLGLASISAGLGNGTGSAVAGLCSRHFGYSFAFVIQSIVLFFLWVVMIFTPARWFKFRMISSTDEEALEAILYSNSNERRGHLSSFSGDPDLLLQLQAARKLSIQSVESPVGSPRLQEDEMSMWQSFKIVIGSSLWRDTAMAISLCCFITSAVAYLWQNTMEGVWNFSDEAATVSCLLATGVGGIVGVVLGPKLFDGYLGGFETNEGRVRCLRWCTGAACACVVFSTACTSLFMYAAYSMIQYNLPHLESDWLLAFVLLTISLVFALISSLQGTFYGINTDSTTPETATVAAGLTVSMQNIMGFAFGPLIPSIIADVAGGVIKSRFPLLQEESVRGGQFSIGMAFALLAAWPLLCSVALATRAAKHLSK